MYHLTWVTEQLAVGHAPMSYAELDSLRDQGIHAIVNLCGEYCDLHQIEMDYGFEVFYLPVEDDRAPELEALEKALDWLDEAIYLGKKVLVHCRLGIGRTGTFITSYLLRRGFGLRLAEKRLKKLRSTPSSFSQWWFLFRYGKRSGKLAIREPSLEGARLVDLSTYFGEYEALAEKADEAFREASAHSPELRSCGLETDACCRKHLSLQFIEAAYLNHHLNRALSSEDREKAIHRGGEMGRRLRGMAQVPTGELTESTEETPFEGEVLSGSGEADEYLCPLNVDQKCILYSRRPVACRLFGVQEKGTAAFGHHRQEINLALYEISRSLFFALNGTFLEGRSFVFPMPHVVSGRFIQDYFAVLVEMASSGKASFPP